MPTLKDRQRVYSWVTKDWNANEPPRTLPAVRLWADVVLEIVAESRPKPPQPPIAIRRTSIFAWPQPLPPELVASATVGRRRVELVIAPTECGVARIDIVQELFDPMSWRRLGVWLLDQGHDRNDVEEAVVPIAHPIAMMFVDGARQVVESTPFEMLGDILSYFRPVAEQYLNSWTRLSATIEKDAFLEIIVPPSAIIEVHA